MEPVSLLVGGVLLAVGFVAGPAGPTAAAAPPPPVTPLCGCGHALSQHDRETSTCYAELRRDTFDKRGRWAGHTWVPCTCRQYVGPRPIDEVFAPRLLPPDGRLNRDVGPHAPRSPGEHVAASPAPHSTRLRASSR